MVVDIYLTFSHDLNTWLCGMPGDWYPCSAERARDLFDCDVLVVEVLDI